MTYFKNSYTTQEKLTANPTEETKKIILSNDAYALGEMIGFLISKLEHLRMRL